MKPEKIIEIITRELSALGTRWRMDVSDFDGRTLRNQLSCLTDWADKALKGESIKEFKEFTENLEEMRKQW